MQLKFCSMTGADDDVNPAELLALSRAFPFVEWAVLLMPSRAGTPRFPTLSWIDGFIEMHRAGNTAMHLCEDALTGFSAGDHAVLGLVEQFKRIQLNFKFGDIDGKYDIGELVERVRAMPRQQFIIQYAEDKKNLLPLFKNIPNCAVLYDASAGRGVAPEKWDAPIDGFFCGYAGGLNPDNVAHHLGLISTAAAGHTTWIDMESGIRTNDRFDLKKVRSVLETAAPFAAARAG